MLELPTFGTAVVLVLIAAIGGALGTLLLWLAIKAWEWYWARASMVWRVVAGTAATLAIYYLVVLVLTIASEMSLIAGTLNDHERRLTILETQSQE